MKVLKKEHLMLLIDHNFEDGQKIVQQDEVLQKIWEQFGEDYFYEGSRLVNDKGETL